MAGLAVVVVASSALPSDAATRINARSSLHGLVDGFDAEHDNGSTYRVASKITGAGEYWSDHYTGRGVDIALIDSGVVPVEGLNSPGQIIYGPDLSFESQSDEHRYLDTYGHGTHMAGIIAGHDADAKDPVKKDDREHFLGMAPDSRIVSVKVADATGATDVSQVIAAIDWVVKHRNDNGMNIRVLNLSFGTDGTQDYRIDPLAHAVEAAWRKGIVVVVAAGNRGYGSTTVNNPAYDPYVITVGAADAKGSRETKDDKLTDFSSRGDDRRRPDLVAPGQSIVSLRAPGSYADVTYPSARVADRFFRGSGTSQAAAVVSGAAALIIQQRPEITPDQLKALLIETAGPIPGAGTGAGAGMLDLKKARGRETPEAHQSWEPATGTGSLDKSRGSMQLSDAGVVLDGEQDIFGERWVGERWSQESRMETSWVGGFFNGTAWTGDCWCTSTWAGNAWAQVTWTASSWSGTPWSGNRWSGNRWSNGSWSGGSWAGNRWSSATWSGDAWSSATWDQTAATR